MLVVTLDEVRPGTKLAMGVMHPAHRQQELLRAGFCLDATMIDRLKGLGIAQVFVDFPGLDDLDKYLEPFLGPERKKVYEGVKASIATAERETRPIASYDAYYTATRDFISQLITRPENRAMLDLLNSNSGDAGEDVAHATSVAHLSLVIGLRMQAYLIRERPRLPPYNARDVTNLGVAGMLHDVGKCKLPPALRERTVLSTLETDEERAEWQTHSRIGYELIRHHVETTTAAAVLHHHQRFDGNGFPAMIRHDDEVKVVGSKIHPFARILAAADLFDRLSVGDDGRRRTNYEVLDLMRTNHAAWLDPEVLATLPQVLPPFSPGRRVTLSDGTYAIVTGFHATAPYLPLVKRIRLEDLQLADEVIDLRDCPDLKITELDGRPVTAPGVPAVPAAGTSVPPADPNALNAAAA